jgi:hypothetical protein
VNEITDGMPAATAARAIPVASSAWFRVSALTRSALVPAKVETWAEW